MQKHHTYYHNGREPATHLFWSFQYKKHKFWPCLDPQHRLHAFMSKKNHKQTPPKSNKKPLLLDTLHCTARNVYTHAVKYFFRNQQA
jgi:hypothetical protein